MNDILTLQIESLTHDGRGLARAHCQSNTQPTATAKRSAPGLGRNRGTVIFVTGALPGETVRARVTRRKSSFVEAEALEVVQPAPHAAPALCPHHGQCGGCPLQTMPYDTQLHWKRRIALDAMIRIGGMEAEQIEGLFTKVHPSPTVRQYRNKVELAFAGGGQEPLTLGMRLRNGRGVTPVPHCALMSPEARAISTMMADLAAKSGLPAHTPQDEARYRLNGQNGEDAGFHQQHTAHAEDGIGKARRTRPGWRSPAGGRPDSTKQDQGSGFWRFLILRRGLGADLRGPRWWALCITSPGRPEVQAMVQSIGQKLLRTFPQLAGFVHEERVSEDALAQGQKRVEVLGRAGEHDPAASRMWLPLGGKHFCLDVASFFQVNTASAQLLAETAEGMFERHVPQTNPALLDLYCGVGAPGLLLGRRCGRLLGLEQDARAVAFARTNASRMGLAHCTYETGDAALRLDKLIPTQENFWNQAEHWDAVLVDPPRAGLAPRALNALLRLNPHTIMYISCNPATLARDASRLRGAYRLLEMTAVDLFPHTPHVECLTLWQSL
ncbi:MAG: class I SAM-dependent RNA methyltransferase [Desulfovibrio sp.]|nr:class I SAM-dependent RNA methyltransferase [Desulfovibrio sp.]